MAAAYYAFDTRNPTVEAKAFARAIMEAGAKAYIYHQAGYTLEAKKPSSKFDIIRHAIDMCEQHEEDINELREENIFLRGRLSAIEEKVKGQLVYSSRYNPNR